MSTYTITCVIDSKRAMIYTKQMTKTIFKRPLDMHDILIECVNYEDRLSHAHTPPPALPKHPEAPRFRLTPASAYVLGSQMIKRLPSLILP